VGFSSDEKFRQGAIVSNQAKNIDHFTEYANTIMARDYKGFGNQGMNAVIIKKE
jgi:hypothetical protein